MFDAYVAASVEGLERMHLAAVLLLAVVAASWLLRRPQEGSARRTAWGLLAGVLVAAFATGATAGQLRSARNRGDAPPIVDEAGQAQALAAARAVTAEVERFDRPLFAGAGFDVVPLSDEAGLAIHYKLRPVNLVRFGAILLVAALAGLGLARWSRASGRPRTHRVAAVAAALVVLAAGAFWEIQAQMCASERSIVEVIAELAARSR